MLIGQKLNIGFEHDDGHRRLYGRRAILPYLRELGVEVVEAPVGPQTETDAFRDHVARCVDAGLQVTMHPYTEGSVFNLAYFQDSADNPSRLFHERTFELAAEAAQRQKRPTVVNIHGARGTTADSRADLVARSAAFFAWARQWCDRNAPLVNVTVELQIRPNPDEPWARIGDSYEELLEVSVGGDVGVCWDFGHAYWNSHNYGDPLEPTDRLLGRIAHVHCHDLKKDDHQPLVYGVIPWRAFIKRLIDNGYDERIILEVPTDAFLDAGGLDSVVASIEALREWTECCERPAGGSAKSAG